MNEMHELERHVDGLLRRAYELDAAPAPGLADRVCKALAEAETPRRRVRLSRPAAVAAVAAVVLLLSVGAYAASRFLRAGELAEVMDFPELAELFEGQDVIELNQSVTAGDYTFSLRAVTRSEQDVYTSSSGDRGHFYAVVAVTRKDLEGLEEIPPREYTEISADVTVTPLVKGCAPWHVNAVGDRIILYKPYKDAAYIVTDCADFTCFADRGLYLGVCTDRYVRQDAFLFDEATGEIAANPDFQGASAVFELPVDPSLADPETAREIVERADYFYPDNGVAYEPMLDEPAWERSRRLFLLMTGEPVPGTERTMTPDKNGQCVYEAVYDGQEVSRTFAWKQEEETDRLMVLNEAEGDWSPVPFDEVVYVDVDADPVWGVHLTVDEDLTFTAEIVTLPE